MMSSELLKKFPDCPHRKESFCTWITQRIGRLYGVTPLVCNFTCRRHGPHCGKPAANESGFIRQMWERSSPLGDNNLARRVASNYARPVDVHVPSLWPEIKASLAHIQNSPGYRGVMLTGSVILRRADSLKDLDIVLRFDDVTSALAIREALPKTIAGIKTDFFFYIGQNPDVYFACLDCDSRKLYVSRWLPLVINSIEPGIEIIEKGSNDFGEQIVKRLATKNPKEVAQARQGWLGVFREWERLTSFVAAARSRGILATAKHIAGLNESDGFHCHENILQRRQRSCFGSKTEMPCPVLVTNAGGQRFCGACGCGETQLARLDADAPEQYTKLHYPVLRCPLNRDGFTT